MPRFDIPAVLRQIFGFPQIAAFLPAIVLGAYWLGGEIALICVALGVPLLM